MNERAHRTGITSLSLLLLAALSAGGAGCSALSSPEADGGAGATSASCQLFTPCGGDPSGSWTVESTCVLARGLSGLPAECQDTLSFDSATASASLSFTASTATQGTLDSSASTLSLQGRARYSMACLAALGESASSETCSAIATQLQASGAFSQVDCSVAGGSCDCPFVTERSSPASSVSYALQGSQILTAGNAADYCVSGSTLELAEPDATSTTVFTLRRGG